MTEDNSISEITRRAIIDELATSGLNWSGRLDDLGFLARLYDLESLPSTDLRYKTAAQDIAQHRIAWSDWEDDWIFFDDRFGLRQGSDETFLRFLAETVHPVIRPDPQEARRLAERYNSQLQADGWSLIENGTISGRPIFVPARSGIRHAAFPEPTGWQKVDRQLQEARLRLDTGTTEEQFQAVGLLCREILISAAQEVFDPKRHPTLDGIPASPTDATRMLEAFCATELSGGSNEESRAHAKAALKLALALQHRRNADFRTAALCVEATSSVVNLAAIIAGRRG